MTDHVEHWKRVARAQMASATGSSSEASLSVRVSFGFALLCAICGVRFGVAGALATLAGLTSLVLVQELPRGLLARAFGRPSRVAVTVLGAHTEIGGPPLGRVANLAVEVVGSLCNMLVALVAFGLMRLGISGQASAIVHALALSHALWGLAQILPFVPFRAGIAVSTRVTPAQRFAHAAASTIVALGAGAWVDAAKLYELSPLLMFVAFASAVTLVRAGSERLDERSGASRLAVEASALFWEGKCEQAVDRALKGLSLARSPRLRERLRTTLAWAAIGKRDPFLAHKAIYELADGAIDFHLIAAYLSCCNRIDEAEQLLLEARGFGHRDREATRLLLDVLLRRGKSTAALDLARMDERLLAEADWAALEAVLPNARHR